MTRSRRQDIPARRKPPIAGAQGGLLERYRGLPPWLQAVAALVPAVLAVLGFLGYGASQDPADRLTIEDRATAGNAFVVSGTYNDLDPDSETIVVMLVLDEPAADARFTTVEAELSPASSAAPSGDADAREDGTWQARVPFSQSGAYLLNADIIRARRGAGFSSEVTAELREEGPDASVVVESTDSIRVEP